MTLLRNALAFTIVLACAIAEAQGTAPPSTTQPSGRWHDVSMEAYRQHLEALSTLVDACAKARSVRGCDPTQIGPDDRVSIVNGSRTELRLIRYGWLRVLFSKAQDADAAAKANSPIKRSGGSGQNPAQNPAKDPAQAEPATSQLLRDAKLRLERDLAQSHQPVASAPDHAQEAAVLRQVLAGPEFRGLQRANVRESVLEKFGTWLNRLFESAVNFKTRSAWVGRALVWGFIVAVCVALACSLMRLERKWRVRLTPDMDMPAPGAASARDWQLWLEDAQRAANSGLWREAIHFVYWASISRLESRRLWPADRARTPREYLALVDAGDPRKPGLSQLTHTFERVWYGGRDAGESDYKSAENLATALISGGSRTGAAGLPLAQEGGAR